MDIEDENAIIMMALQFTYSVIVKQDSELAKRQKDIIMDITDYEYIISSLLLKYRRICEDGLQNTEKST